MSYENILYEKFGYEIKLLEKKDGIDIFRLLSPVKLDRKDRIPEMHSHDRKILKDEIVFALEDYNYNSVGLYRNGELIGISFSNMIDDEDQPWLGYFYIQKEHRKGKGSVVLLNYIINHLYKEYTIQIGATDMKLYGKVIRYVPILEYYIFKKGVAERLSRICDSGSEVAA